MPMLAAALALALAPPVASGPSFAAVARSEAYYHFSLGLQARLAGDTDDALAEYRRAQKLDPSASPIRVEIARLLRDLGRLDQAAEEARAAVGLDADDADAHLILAQLEQTQAAGPAAEAALRRAAAEYENVVRVRPTDGQSLLHLAGIYGQLRQHKDAARIWGMYVALDPGNFEAHVQRGTHLLLARESEQAVAALKTALELQPDSSRAYQMLGDIYARGDDVDQAVLNFRKALDIEPENVRIRLALGEVLLGAKRPKEALAEAEDVLSTDPANRFAQDLKARSLRDLRRFDEAVAVADALVASDPKDQKAAYLQVTIAEARRDFAAAAKRLEEILSRPAAASDEGGSDRRVFLVHLGFAYQQLERYLDAAKAFARARDEGGSPDANLLSFHAEALYLAKQHDEALAAVRAARERFPDDVDLTGLEATLLREKGDEAAATALIEGLRAKAPQEEKSKVLGRVADFYRRAGRYDEAERALREALEADPKSLGSLFQLGAVLERQKRHDDAEAVVRQALVIEPDSAPVLNYLGYMNADRNVRVEEALTLVQKAVEIDPQSGAYQDSLGWALYRLNRLEAAEEAVRRALERDGDNAVVLDHMGDIQARRGRVAEALSYWQRALKGEDEEKELDRPRVEAKIRDAQGALRAQQQQPDAPPTP
ncbi:MAG TPA: tetratricopeptide repeat protein [Vicinamibacteria bacterium]|nr:tetratricopeptide repeat protein [Vicinamibacteria bacterium]